MRGWAVPYVYGEYSGAQVLSMMIRPCMFMLPTLLFAQVLDPFVFLCVGC